MANDGWEFPSWSARECDLDSPQVAVIMQPVPHGSESVFEVNRRNEAELEAARFMYRYFTAEMGYDNFGLGMNDGEHLWLVRADRIRRGGYSLVCGGAEVLQDGGSAVLRWIWIHPMCRGERSRANATLRLWNKLHEVYGELELEKPVSAAMQAFMAKQGR